MKIQMVGKKRIRKSRAVPKPDVIVNGDSITNVWLNSMYPKNERGDDNTDSRDSFTWTYFI